MSIEFTCPQCQVKIRVLEKYSGKKGKCPKCKTSVVVPNSRGSKQVLSKSKLTNKTSSAGKGIHNRQSRSASSVTAVPLTKCCPHCAEEILAVAKKCRYCKEILYSIENEYLDERTLLWRSSGMERSFIPSSFFAIRITSKRIILINLGGALHWFLLFGLIGVAIGRKRASKHADAIASLETDDILRRVPGCTVIDRADVNRLEFGYSLFKSPILELQSNSHGNRQFVFNNFGRAHADEIRNSLNIFMTGKIESHVTKSNEQGKSGLLPQYFGGRP